MALTSLASTLHTNKNRSIDQRNTTTLLWISVVNFFFSWEILRDLNRTSWHVMQLV
jgi:hypothetical protein